MDVLCRLVAFLYFLSFSTFRVLRWTLLHIQTIPKVIKSFQFLEPARRRAVACACRFGHVRDRRFLRVLYGPRARSFQLAIPHSILVSHHTKNDSFAYCVENGTSDGTAVTHDEYGLPTSLRSCMRQHGNTHAARESLKAWAMERGDKGRRVAVHSRRIDRCRDISQMPASPDEGWHASPCENIRLRCR